MSSKLERLDAELRRRDAQIRGLIHELNGRVAQLDRREAQIRGLYAAIAASDDRARLRKDNLQRAREALVAEQLRSARIQTRLDNPVERPPTADPVDAVDPVELRRALDTLREQLSERLVRSEPASESAEPEVCAAVADETSETPIFRYWRATQVRSKLALDGVDDVEDFFLKQLVQLCTLQPDWCHPILCLGTADFAFERALARRALDCGVENFALHCAEAHARPSSQRSAFPSENASHLRFVGAELSAGGPYPLCLAHESLVHTADPRVTLEAIRGVLTGSGRLVASSSLVRSNPVEPSVGRAIVENIWQLVPPDYKRNRARRMLTQRYEESAPWTSQGPALLPLLKDLFHFEVFIAFGHVIHAFIDDEIGPNFDPAIERDKRFIDQVAELDDAKIDAGLLRPTHALLSARTTPVVEALVHRHWTPEFCLGEIAAPAPDVSPPSPDRASV